MKRMMMSLLCCLLAVGIWGCGAMQKTVEPPKDGGPVFEYSDKAKTVAKAEALFDWQPESQRPKLVAVFACHGRGIQRLHELNGKTGAEIMALGDSDTCRDAMPMLLGIYSALAEQGHLRERLRLMIEQTFDFEGFPEDTTPQSESQQR